MIPNKSLIFIIATLTLVTACGIHVSSDPLKVEGNVTHTVTIDEAQVLNFFKAYCEGKPENDTPEKVDDCVNHQLGLFWAAVANATPQPSPSPSN